MKIVWTVLVMMACSVATHAQQHAYGDAPHPSVLMDAVLDPAIRELVMPRHAHAMSPMAFPSTTLDTSIDVQHYDVFMDWSTVMSIPRAQRGPRKCDARVQLRVVVKAVTLDTLKLNARELTFDSIRVNGQSAGHSLSFQRVNIPLPTQARRGDTLDVVINYGIMRDDLGFQSYANTDISQSGRPLAITFTFNQPQGARTWYPCNDVPYDKATFLASMAIPKDFVGVANGRRVSRTPLNDSVVVETWRHEEPMATYLFNMNASRYTMFEQTYVSSTGDTIPIENYQWSIDEDSATYSARRAVRNVPDMFRVMEELFGPYPFTSYGHVAVYPIQFGGMEHQSMSMVNREWLRGTAELGYMHEIGHQWFGDWVTCATWDDIWLNEGAASWTEALFAGRDGNSDAYRLRMRQRRDRYLRNGLAEPPVYGIPLANLFNEATTYCKSAWVYHMMRTQFANDTALFGHLRTYMSRFARGATQTSDLLDFMKDVAPNPVVDWDVYFDQWLAKAGHPIFSGTLDLPPSSEPTRRVTLMMSQVQQAANVPDVFHVPVRIRFRSSSATKDTIVLVTSKTITVDMMMPTEPTEVIVNPLDEILCEAAIQVITSVDAESAAPWCRVVGPVPSTDAVMLQLDEHGDATVSVSDVQGRLLLSTTVTPGLNRIAVPASQGVVIIRVDRPGASTAFALHVIGH